MDDRVRSAQRSDPEHAGVLLQRLPDVRIPAVPAVVA